MICIYFFVKSHVHVLLTALLPQVSQAHQVLLGSQGLKATRGKMDSLDHRGRKGKPVNQIINEQPIIEITYIRDLVCFQSFCVPTTGMWNSFLSQ